MCVNYQFVLSLILFECLILFSSDKLERFIYLFHFEISWKCRNFLEKMLTKLFFDLILFSNLFYGEILKKQLNVWKKFLQIKLGILWLLATSTKINYNSAPYANTEI